MSIQSTQTITRTEAIDRIVRVVDLAFACDYRGIFDISFEPDLNIADYTYQITSMKVSDIDRWTNGMLEDVMDKQFIRYSMFDNYKVVDG